MFGTPSATTIAAVHAVCANLPRSGFRSPDYEIIRRNPTESALIRFSWAFTKVCTQHHISSKNEDDMEHRMYQLLKVAPNDMADLSLDLILFLQALPAARVLPSHHGRRTIDADLAVFYCQLICNRTGFEKIIPTFKHALKRRVNDIQLWSAVFDMLADLRAATPPPPEARIDGPPVPIEPAMNYFPLPGARPALSTNLSPLVSEKKRGVEDPETGGGKRRRFGGG
jgi:hypothetical protein